MTDLVYTDLESALKGADTLVLVGSKKRLRSQGVIGRIPAAARGCWGQMLNETMPGDTGSSTETWLEGDGPARLIACVLPSSVSRHNSPARPHAIAQLLDKALPNRGCLAVVLAVDEEEHAFASGCAVARALPLYSRKSKSKREGENGDSGSYEARAVRVAILCDQPLADGVLEHVAAAADGIRLAARLGDMPASELHTDAFVEQLRSLAEVAGASIDVVRGRELEERGYGGLWHVGKTALNPPALVVLSHEPEGATETIAWVGKGIVYDTGGLSLKGKAHMPGMKGDMGGAAAVAGAFLAATRSGFPQRLHAVLCLAENAIGPSALRPDDVITMASGKTVEVNNTDAEGRLVLADGVAHAVAHLSPDVIVDLATLTGAQPVATGRKHAGIVCSDEALEDRTILAGRASGDLVHPLPYCPELFRQEFTSKVADLKNSVKDRANAQSSCAAQFIAEHLGDYTGPWLHVDMAGPFAVDERATGYGVALLTQLFVR